jgi:plastocyanin
MHTVVIDQMKFGPVPAGIRSGDAILWVNRDFLKHSAAARDCRVGEFGGSRC